MPWKRYTWIGPDYSWGRDVFGFFNKYFEEIGAPVEWVDEIWHPLGEKHFDNIAQRIMTGKPDALVVASWGEDLRHFIQTVKPSGLFEKIPSFGWFSMISGETERTLPEGIWKISRGPFNYLSEQFPQTRTFVDEFAKKFNTYPLGFSVCCFVK